MSLVHHTKSNSKLNNDSQLFQSHNNLKSNHIPKQTQEDILYHQQTSDSQDFQKVMKSNTKFNFADISIQPKLKISHHDDPYEKEADRIANQIMRMPSVSNEDEIWIQNNLENKIQKKCSSCKIKNKEEELKINRKSQSSSNNLYVSENISNQIMNNIECSMY